MPFPCVVKPLVLSASRGVIRADDPASLRAALDRVGGLLRSPQVAVRRDPELSKMLVEEFLPGPEVALEGLLTRGSLQVLALFDKPDPLDGPYFEETLYVTPSRHPPDAQNQKIDEEVRGTNSIALHVRRGDYVSNPITNRIHGTCSIAYYNEAVETIARKISGPHFFVFTDDFVWAKENLKFDFPITYATGNGPENSYEDLRLMSLCKHNIVANSSFSWWGAWLNQNPAKIIIAPTHWFDRYAADTRDLLPESWVKL